MYLFKEFEKTAVMLFFLFLQKCKSEKSCLSLLKRRKTSAQLGIHDWDSVCPIIPISTSVFNDEQTGDFHNFQYLIYVDIYQITLADGCR